MITELSSIALAASVDPEGDSLEDISFNMLTSWMHSCLSKSQADKLEGYASFMEMLTDKGRKQFDGLNEEDRLDFDFLTRVKDPDLLKEFIEPLTKEYTDKLGLSFKTLFDAVFSYTKLIKHGLTQ